MAEETKKAIETICSAIESGKVLREAVEIAIDLHTAEKEKEKNK